MKKKKKMKKGIQQITEARVILQTSRPESKNEKIVITGEKKK